MDINFIAEPIKIQALWVPFPISIPGVGAFCLPNFYKLTPHSNLVIILK
jgi:hypothetical protein